MSSLPFITVIDGPVAHQVPCLQSQNLSPFHVFFSPIPSSFVPIFYEMYRLQRTLHINAPHGLLPYSPFENL